MKKIILLVVAIFLFGGCAINRGEMMENTKPVSAKISAESMIRWPMLYECFGLKKEEAVRQMNECFDDSWAENVSGMPVEMSYGLARHNTIIVIEKAILKYMKNNIENRQKAVDKMDEAQKISCRKFVDEIFNEMREMKRS